MDERYFIPRIYSRCWKAHYRKLYDGKDSVKNRIGSESKEGMSFTEFTYQLVQGYDFLHLYQRITMHLFKWGALTNGEILLLVQSLIRRIGGGKGYAITCPLITKSDGTKFGKSEGGNVWLDAKRTSPYKFYQYWLNASDEDAEKYIKIFTFLDKETIDALIHRAQRSTAFAFITKTIRRRGYCFSPRKRAL